ncbi:class I SAM-dependent DNA methyltransferase [Burkholderia cenocepacia]|uniref:class I SAM-dependent DNA methyltransferase n=1 Tax=Burkholderia cenocepacia TaxID=95486 RepID=UPI0026527DA4|nr:DNA methyltransferase [Burkholderia cenocepacia]MDN7453297.1 N-6 DNA methylase [Burkholderia cenocepacia]
MNIAQVEEKVKALAGGVKQADFLYDLLECYGKPKASITRLKMVGKGSYNLSKNADEVLWKKQVYYKTTNSDKLLTIIDGMKHADVVAKHQPRFIIAINTTHLLAIDTKTEDTLDIPLAELNKKFDFFLPWAGLEKTQAQGENPADVKAAEKMAKLFDLLRDSNPATTAQEIHWQNVFLSRILFCYFAEDTGIFPAKLFTNHIGSHTAEDGGDLDEYLSRAFDIMNQEDRKGVPEYLADFPYVNGGLFADKLPVPKFNRKSRAMLIECGADLNWSEINPDIFGSMIQAVVDPSQRGNMGMHYTSVPNIMKVIEPLFLDELKEEFEKHSDSKTKLEQLLLRLEHLKIFDPACGSGNFLIVAYKELRELEMEIFKRLQELSQEGLMPLSRIKLSQFYGIELDDFAHEIAILSLWLKEHQMNLKFKALFGHTTPSLPLKSGGNVICANATSIDWNTVCPKKDEDVFILGNPPYVGFQNQTDEQKEEIINVFDGFENFKRIDYIGCWFKKAADYIAGSNSASFAFVSTNSICQGEQVCIIWPHIFSLGLEISFAHQSFDWGNNAKNQAKVTCIIVGLKSAKSIKTKILYNETVSKQVKNISPYLLDSDTVIVTPTNRAISNIGKMSIGNVPLDGNNFILSEEEKDEILRRAPAAKKFIRKYMGAADFMSGNYRYCLWVTDATKAEAEAIPPIMERINKCREFRQAGGVVARQHVEVSHRFRTQPHQETPSIIFPKTTSSRRVYVPAGFLDQDTIISEKALAAYDAQPYLFGVLSSKMHMVWLSVTSSRMRNDFQYSVQLTYNTFPFPKATDTQKIAITECVFMILAARENYPERNLAQLYDPEKMPKDLLYAHESMDRVVESVYRAKPFDNDEDRLEHLFKLYKKMTEAEHA